MSASFELAPPHEVPKLNERPGRSLDQIRYVPVVAGITGNPVKTRVRCANFIHFSLLKEKQVWSTRLDCLLPYKWQSFAKTFWLCQVISANRILTIKYSNDLKSRYQLVLYKSSLFPWQRSKQPVLKLRFMDFDDITHSVGLTVSQS